MHRDGTQPTASAGPREFEAHQRAGGALGVTETRPAGSAASVPNDVAHPEARTGLVFFFVDLGLSRLTFLNRRVTDFFGYTGVTRESALEAMLSNVHPDDIARVREQIASWTSRGNRPATGDIEFRANAGPGGGREQWRWMRCCTIVFEPDTEGAAPAILGTAEDVTERRKRSGLSDMATEVAHELSQPLSAIANYALGCSERLRSPACRPEEVLSAIERISSEALRASEFVRHLRTLASDRPPSHGVVDANLLVTRVAAAVAPDAIYLRIGVEVALDPSLPEIDGDRFQLEHVLLNLVRNSFDSIRSAGKVGGSTVIRTAALDGGGISISVSDSGSGVPAELAVRIFEPQFTTKARGMGLGLSISKSIVEAHGGTITVESEEGSGATFRVELPAGDARKDLQRTRGGARRAGRPAPARVVVKESPVGSPGSDVRT